MSIAKLKHKIPYFTLLAALVLSGCSVANFFVDPYEKVTFITTEDLNPDIYHRSSPVQVSVMHLTSRTTFDNMDFDSLFNNASTVLSNELLLEERFILQPNETLQHKIPVPEGTSFSAIIVGFRDIDQANWRHVIPISDNNYFSHKYQITSNTINIINRRNPPTIKKEHIDDAKQATKSARTVVETADKTKSLVK